MNQAGALHVRWKERADLSTDCKHLNLEMDVDDLGHSTGNITCFICGELVVHKPPRIRFSPTHDRPRRGLSCHELDGRGAD
jgi:hypothetical protein